VRRRLVLSTIAVVVVVIAVLSLPVLFVVRDAEGGTLPAGVLVRLGVIAGAAIGAAALLAGVQARQLARPLERLARSASRVGDGDFSAASSPPSGIAEIDDIARALRLSANRVDRMLESERSFTADATHQLRTGLTGIAMRLEVLERTDDNDLAREADAALTQIHELNATLDELLSVARRGSTGERTDFDLTELVDHQVADWHQRFAERRRQVVVTTGRVERVVATPGLVGQVISILLENALRHGRGTVAVLVHDTTVTVEDEGPGISPEQAASLFVRPKDPRAAHGRGLALARRLAESDGGNLELTQLSPPTFRLTLVPVTAPVEAAISRGRPDPDPGRSGVSQR
jgi:signal transduction histidine kinase